MARQGKSTAFIVLVVLGAIVAFGGLILQFSAPRNLMAVSFALIGTGTLLFCLAAVIEQVKNRGRTRDLVNRLEAEPRRSQLVRACRR